MYKFSHFMTISSDVLLKLTFGFIFFNYGYAKLENLILGNAEGLINMVSSIPIFGFFPILFSWILAFSELTIFIGLLYGLFSFLPYSNFATKLSGLLALLITTVIIYLHIFAWGDNIFIYGPFEFLNVQDDGKSVFGQILFIPISFYIIFSNSQNNNNISDAK